MKKNMFIMLLFVLVMVFPLVLIEVKATCPSTGKCGSCDDPIKDFDECGCTVCKWCDYGPSDWCNSGCAHYAACFDGGTNLGCVVASYCGCGNGICNTDENFANCPADCPSSSGSEPTCSSSICGLFYKQCSGSTCIYYDANITAAAAAPCINTTAASKKITVTGENNYCGDLEITVLSDVWEETQTVEMGDDKGQYSVEFDIPDDEIARYAQTKQPLSVKVIGNRNSIKEPKDTDDYGCDTEVFVSYAFDNFYYCPTFDEVINDDFDYYDDAGYYDVKDSVLETYYAWEDCYSNVLKDACSPGITNCVDNLRERHDANATFDPDNDGEYEVCYSEDLIQGGWLDADSGEDICDKVDGYFSRTTQWFTCATPGPCLLGKNDYYNSKAYGLCCGDDLNEKPLQTALFNGTSGETFSMTGSFSSCCSPDSSCADKEGICRQNGFEQCLAEGTRGKCQDSRWNISYDAECQNPCMACNVNKVISPESIDTDDLSSIRNAIEHSIPDYDDPIYDTNKDGDIDQGDYDYCEIFLGQPCSACIDGIFQESEECNIQDEEVVFHSGIAPPYRCDGTKAEIRDNTTCLPSCDAKYTSQCLKGYCGASCGSDSDCTPDPANKDYFCNSETCLCEAIGCPVGTALCTDGTCKSNCTAENSENQGCIEENGFCEDGEGCACPDCLNQRDSCVYWARCGANELCTCPFGTSLCLDGTCSFDCSRTDTAPQGCIIQNTICEPGEGCGCADCNNKTDSCILGGVCNFLTEQCEEACTKTEDPEVSLYDGKDNDCDGLIDEPEFWPGYGVYIWEAGCKYFMCVYADDSAHHNTSGTFSVSGDYKIYSLKQYDFETGDNFAASSDTKQVSFSSKLYNDMDCLIFKTDTSAKYELALDGVKSTDKIYLTQRKEKPLNNPFYFASPECSLSCNSPGSCGSTQVWPLPSPINCGYEQCIFDCGGYWINVSSIWDVSGFYNYPEDYCSACTGNMKCSDYTNIPSCNFDPCFAALTPFGCKWNTSNGKCIDNFEYCMPGTTLCKDGTCSQDCEETDWKNSECIGRPDKICQIGEGCSCPDCEDKRDTCISGAVCGDDELCGCPVNTTLCNDNTCDETCGNHSGKTGCLGGAANGICEFEEGCACRDCEWRQDSCSHGLVCDIEKEICINLPTVKCKKGTTLCRDFTCDETCNNHGGKMGCISEPDGKCETGEGCACEDCYEKRDSCDTGLRCDEGEELCLDDSGSSACVDYDNDGYFAKYQCSMGTDCDDSNANVHPGAVELCNGIDDNCNGLIDDNCVSDVQYALDITIESAQKVNVLDTFKLKLKVTNKYSKAFENIKMTIQAPEKISVKSNSAVIPAIAPKETKEISLDIIVKDYAKESATLKLKAQMGDAEITSKDIPLSIEIPEFAILAMPGSEHDDGNYFCTDLYYVLDKERGTYDIELDIKDPEAFFGKSVLVDYVSNIESAGDIIIEPMLSNPYCLPTVKDYEIDGYLYKTGFFGIVDNVDRARNAFET